MGVDGDGVGWGGVDGGSAACRAGEDQKEAGKGGGGDDHYERCSKQGNDHTFV